jgi:hypothetical protein
MRLNAILMAKEHKKMYFQLKQRLKYFRLPVIIISCINGVISIGTDDFFGRRTVIITTCLLSLSCSILGSIELFLGIQQNMETELATYKLLYSLASELFKTLSLFRQSRTGPGKEYLEQKYEQYFKIIERALPLKRKIADQLLVLPDREQLRHGPPFVSRMETASIPSAPSASHVSSGNSYVWSMFFGSNSNRNSNSSTSGGTSTTNSHPHAQAQQPHSQAQSWPPPMQIFTNEDEEEMDLDVGNAHTTLRVTEEEKERTLG